MLRQSIWRCIHRLHKILQVHIYSVSLHAYALHVSGVAKVVLMVGRARRMGGARTLRAMHIILKCMHVLNMRNYHHKIVCYNSTEFTLTYCFCFPWEANLSTTLNPRHMHACRTGVVKFERSQLDSSRGSSPRYCFYDQFITSGVMSIML